MKKTLTFFLILVNLFLMVGCKKESTLIKQSRPIRIINWGFALDGGTKFFSYINNEDKIINISIDKRVYPKGSTKSDTGRLYLDVYPDDINYMKDEKEILSIIKDLKFWYQYNIKIWTNKKSKEYYDELEDKLESKKSDFAPNHRNNLFYHTIGIADFMEDAFDLLSKKYPELYALAP